MGKIIIIQPGLQHSHQLAWALESKGLLKSFWSGVPVRPIGFKQPVWMPSKLWHRMREVDICDEHIKSHPQWWLLMRSAMSAGDKKMRFRNMHRAFYAIDYMAARHILDQKPKLVIAYENSSLNIFRAAKLVGAKCVLDAASLHFDRGNKLLNSVDLNFQPIIDERKRREIDLADHVICCSSLARDSYTGAGVREEKVFSVPLGAVLPFDFGSVEKKANFKWPIKIAYAGSMHVRKSIDLIFSAINNLSLEFPGKLELHIYGGSSDEKWIKCAKSMENVIFHGQVPQASLFSALADSDVLLLPSRFDSFGMVVAESMAVGTPVIVSNQTGAKSIIEEHPGSGWIIDASLIGIENMIRSLIKNPIQMIDARAIALRASRDYTWDKYRERVGSVIEGFL